MSVEQPTAQEIVAKMVALHAELANFQYYLMHQTQPPSMEGEDYKACTKVAIAIEREVARLQKHIKQVAIDDVIHEAMKREGIKPDEPKA